MRTQVDADKAVLLVGFARLDVVALSVAFSFVFALFLFLATVSLVLVGEKGDPNIGYNLKVLSVYFPGYSISWVGGLIGGIYAGVLGFMVGLVTAILWNLSHYVYIALVVVRALWWRMMAD